MFSPFWNLNSKITNLRNRLLTKCQLTQKGESNLFPYYLLLILPASTKFKERITSTDSKNEKALTGLVILNTERSEPKAFHFPVFFLKGMKNLPEWLHRLEWTICFIHEEIYFWSSLCLLHDTFVWHNPRNNDFSICLPQHLAKT